MGGWRYEWGRWVGGVMCNGLCVQLLCTDDVLMESRLLSLLLTSSLYHSLVSLALNSENTHLLYLSGREGDVGTMRIALSVNT